MKFTMPTIAPEHNSYTIAYYDASRDGECHIDAEWGVGGLLEPAIVENILSAVIRLATTDMTIMIKTMTA